MRQIVIRLNTINNSFHFTCTHSYSISSAENKNQNKNKNTVNVPQIYVPLASHNTVPNMCARCFYVFFLFLFLIYTLRACSEYAFISSIHALQFHNHTTAMQMCEREEKKRVMYLHLRRNKYALWVAYTRNLYTCIFTLHLTDISWLHKPIQIIKSNSVRILDTFLVRRLVGHRFDYILIVITSDCQ